MGRMGAQRLTHTHFLPHQDPIDRIREAFKDSQIIQLLNTYQNDLRTLRNLIHAEIDAAANEFLPVPENTELLRL